MKYRVLVIEMLLLGNRIAKHGEVIEETQLMSSADDLVKRGFIEEVKEVKEVKKGK